MIIFNDFIDFSSLEVVDSCGIILWGPCALLYHRQPSQFNNHGFIFSLRYEWLDPSIKKVMLMGCYLT